MTEFAPGMILCPVDLSAASVVLLSWARLLAERFSAEVEVLHASWSEPPRYFLEDQVSGLAAKEKVEIDQLSRSLRQAVRKALGPKTKFTVEVKEGHAARVILEHARRHHPGLIVMGSHGHSGVARLLLGSVAENVVRETGETGVPVLVVRGGPLPAGQAGIARVLCPVELSAEGCAPTAAHIAGTLGAELLLMRAVQHSQPPTTDLCQEISVEDRSRCRVSEVVRRGNAAEQIVLFAREHAINLIVLRAEPHQFLEFATLGRTVERVMRHAPCSVLILPGSRQEN